MLTDERIDPPDAADERETLNGFLDYLRASVVHKAQGLSDADAARRVLPSLTRCPVCSATLPTSNGGGSATHWTARRRFPPAGASDDPDAEFRVTEQDSLAEIIADYEAACAESREVAARYGLEDMCQGRAQCGA